jgi:hypothetical protein
LQVVSFANTAVPLSFIEIQYPYINKADYDGNGLKVGALGDTEHDEWLIIIKENSFSLREKARMRGYKIKQLSCFIPSATAPASPKAPTVGALPPASMQSSPQPSPGGRGS